MSFSDRAAVAEYAANVVRQVPGVHALHRMAHVLLDEHVPADGNVLVLGAGGGMELAAFADCSPGWRFTGVDPSAEMLALATRTLGPHASRVDLIHGYIASAPDIAFDGATCLLTLHFLDRDARLDTLRELRRRLKPGAPLVIAHHSVPDDVVEKRRWFRRWAAFAAVDSLSTGEASERADMMASRLPTLSPEAETAILQEAGFERPSLFYAALTFRGWVAYAG
ncbi:class I SAM-dependent methyltransferase [Luteimonas fraxinea]|uniref:Class I SAM-dependent methyltransferase n=1 Tax=Luteimonas fraxinea TaxID=2901869 RepID=A0ABS8UCT3_9GAMM|nr:class I SAM-dependent methyltransferase [Luteimonas fraxinea]MCD9096541.1 class I SAM-dependent methyltransferase [Luteimonas fraxinea]UHH10052.1 class I SAM-dependent methyltransferase [Luteimonas fraxinea]